jgi:hypothetical protein
MAQTFIGFNTQKQYKKFTLTDFALIKRDLLNAFNIRQGQLPGRPAYGTTLWDFLFENQQSISQAAYDAIQNEYQNGREAYNSVVSVKIAEVIDIYNKLPARYQRILESGTPEATLVSPTSIINLARYISTTGASIRERLQVLSTKIEGGTGSA